MLEVTVDGYNPNQKFRQSSHTLANIWKVIAQGRPDRADYLGNLDLHENADPFDMLSVSGGYRVTDDYEVFPKLVKADGGSFVCRFFLHGWRHTSLPAQERLNALKPGEELYVTLELTNPVTGLAVQLQTTDYHMIGWTPRYIVSEMARAMTESPSAIWQKYSFGLYFQRSASVSPFKRLSHRLVKIVNKIQDACFEVLFGRKTGAFEQASY